MPKVCKKNVRIGKELFEGEVFLLPNGVFIYVFPDWMAELTKDLAEHGFRYEYNPKRGSHGQACFCYDVTQKALEDKIAAIVEAANKMAAKESLVIFYSMRFELRKDCENEILMKSDYKDGLRGTSMGLTLDWEIVRQFKYSETNILYKHQKYDNRIDNPRKSTNVIGHTPELEKFFKAFDLGLEAMIGKLLVVNDAEVLPLLIEEIDGPEQLMSPEALA